MAVRCLEESRVECAVQIAYINVLTKAILLFTSLLLSFSTYAQIDLDSLLSVWQDTRLADTARFNALNEYLYNAAGNRPDSALVLAGDMLVLATSKKLKRYEVDAMIQQSRAFAMMGDFKNALEAGMRSSKLAEEIGYPYGVARSLGIIGVIYQRTGAYEAAIDYFTRSLGIAEDMLAKAKNGSVLGEIKSYSLTSVIVGIYGGLGLLYKEMGVFVKSIAYYERGLALNEALGRKDNIAAGLNDIANLYVSEGDNIKALDYSQRSLKTLP